MGDLSLEKVSETYLDVFKRNWKHRCRQRYDSTLPDVKLQGGYESTAGKAFGF